MLTRLSDAIQIHPWWNRLLHWQRRILTPGVRRTLGIGLVAAALIFLALALYSGWTQIQPHLQQMNIGRVLTGQVLTFCALIIGAFAWHFCQRGVGITATWQRGISVHLAANGTKYLPGYAWQYISKGYLSKEDGISVQHITLAILTELTLLLGSGVFAASLFALHTPFHVPLPNQESWVIPQTLLWIVASLMVALVIGWGIYVTHSQKPAAMGPQVGAQRLWLLIAWFTQTLGWLTYSLACWFFVAALTDVPLASYGQCIVALVASGIISMMIILVPGGLGIREATLAILLTGIIPLPLGIIIGILMRLSLVISELISLFLIIGLARHWPEQLRQVYPKWGIRQNTPE